MSCARVPHEFVALESVQLERSAEFLSIVERFLSEPFAVFLDSAATDSAYARCSVLAVGPARVLAAWHPTDPHALGEAELELHEWDDARFGAAARIRRWRGQAWAELDRQLQAWALPPELRTALPDLPFIGGAIGVAGYDAGRFLERLPEHAERDMAVPEYCWLFADAVFVHEHASGRTHVIATGRGPTEARARAVASQRIETFRGRLAAKPPEPHVASRVGPLRAYADAEVYADTVRAVHARLAAGDVFEVSVAHRVSAEYAGSAWSLYLALRSVSPAAFACYVVTPWARLLSSSPERFLALDASGHAESRPIKGTRPRGATPAEDAQLRAALASSEKDRAENIMIVDLVRNDLGRVCALDSVHVPELMIVETHPRVFHLVSTVRGTLADGQGPVQLFAACFPPGSMTGAPKIEAMKIIDALEPYRRNFYAGAVGYFDVRGSLDFSVVIRSFVITRDQCHFSVGGAVVIDSDPYDEYRETMDKARAMLEALERVRAASG